MVYTITVFLFIIGIFLCLVKEKYFVKCKSKVFQRFCNFITKDAFYEFVAGIMITILGVTLAIIFTNHDAKKQERMQTIAFLDVVHTELSTKSELIKGMMQMLNEDTDLGEAVNSSVRIMPISPMLSLEVLLTEPPYTTTISDSCYSALLSCRFSSAMQQSRVEMETDKEKMLLNLLLLSNELDVGCKVIEIELEYQNHKISKKEAFQRMDVLMNTPLVDS